MGETERGGGFEIANSEEQTMDWGGHPLFPRAETETGPDRRRFDIIHIQRIKSDGSREICPKAWRGSDLRSWEQVVDAYGGGTYQLMAQCSRTFRFQAYSEKLRFEGLSKPFGEMTPETAPRAVSPQHFAPVPAAPNPSAAIPLGYAHPPPYAYPYPPPAPPPAASENGETLALLRSIIESANSEKAALMRALLERPSNERGPLEVVREILPLIQSIQGREILPLIQSIQGGANGTQAFMKGVELARGLIGQPIQPPAPRAESDLALLGQVLRMVTPAAVAATAAPAAAPPAPSASPATMTQPPGVAPPGYTWGYTTIGWVLVQLGPESTPTATTTQTAQPAANPSSSPTEEMLPHSEVGKLLASLSATRGAA